MVLVTSNRDLWVLLFCFGFFVNDGDAQGTSCKTPDDVNGECIDLRECKPMLQLVSTLKRPYPKPVTQRLNAFKCGTGSSVQICCPPGPISLEAPTPEPPNVVTHKNINILPKTCGYLDTAERIVNGQDAHLNEFPWMALFQYQTENGTPYLCGGSIIHKNYILTAAHCVTELKSTQKLIKIRVGEHSIKNKTDCEIQNDKARTLKCNPPVQDLDVLEIIVHPQFGGRKGDVINDIALVRVSTINLEVENARPVCLPIGVVRDRPYKNVFVTGWGVSDIISGNSSDILQKVGLAVADKPTCVQTYADAGRVLTYKQQCVGGNSVKDSCSGDSGGPMVVPTLIGEDNFVYVQQGIVSYGPKYCGITGYPGVYTLVKYYMDWILDTMKP